MPDKVVEPTEASDPDAAKARALYDYIYGNFTRNPLIEDDVLMGTVSAAATLDLRVWDDYLHIQSVQTLDPGLGGSVALRASSAIWLTSSASGCTWLPLPSESTSSS